MNLKYACGGYLCNPEEDWGHIYNPDLVAFDTILEKPCLVLLGEAGMGKTTAAKQAYSQISQRLSGSEDVCLWFRLGDYESDKDLCDAIFQDETFQAWRRGKHKLYLFLDSLDEGLLSIHKLVIILKREIEKLPCDRLYFRITCRTADWKDSLEQKLKDKWGEANVRIYQLAPLLRENVIEEANKRGINSDDFLREVSNKNAIPLAIKPITLKFLLGIYQNGRFPSSQKDLYEEGCLQMCEEVNPDRCDSGNIGSLNAKKRLIIASRIAALLLFSNKSAIWINPEYGDMPKTDIAIRDLCIGKENIEQQEFFLDENCIKTEILSITELFSSRGTHRIGFAHQTYAEFLAAWYLYYHQTPLDRIMKLFVSSEDTEGKLIPQLHETAAWLASMRTDVLHGIMKTDPDVLLRSDITSASDNDKFSLVESLLKLHNDEKLTYQYNNWLYQNLNHPKLLDQLLPYIYYSTKSINARSVAIDIAEACNVKDVQEYLANVALAPQEHDWVRINAAVAVCNLGDEKTKAKLKPLAVAKIQNDVEEQLKGCGLRAVWPGNITAEELFNTLIQPVSKSIGGRYQDFIAKELGEHLQTSDLTVALRWLEKQVTRRDLGYPFGELSDAIMMKAWEHLNEPEVMQAFARVAFSRLKNHDEIVYENPYKTISFSQVLKDDIQKRRQLIESIISTIPELDKEPSWLLGYRTAIVFEEDFIWLIECLQQSENEHYQNIWAKLIRWHFRRPELNFEHLDAVLTASETNLILRKEFESLIEAIDLNSLRAQQEQARYLEEQEELDKDGKQPLLEPPPKERVLEILNKIEAGQPNLWCSLCFELTLEANSTHYGDLLRSNLTNLPGWIEAEDSTKERIINAARVYLRDGDPENQVWLGTNNFRYSALLGYQALILLRQQTRNFIFSLSAEEWQKWTAIILAYPDWGKTEYREYRQEFIKQAYQNAPSEFLKVLMLLIDKHNREHGDIHIQNLIVNCWDENLAKAIFNKVQDEKLTAKSLGSLLEDLLKYGFIEAKAFAESLITLPLPSSTEERAKAVVAAKALILYTQDASWSVIWPAIQQDTAFGREVMEKITFSVEYSGSIEQRLPEQYIADLYIFLTKQYPDSDNKKQNSSEDEQVTGIEAYLVTPQDSIKTWKNYIPQRLQERGTPQGCEALRKIIRELPELKDKLQWRLLEAETLARRQTWQPFKPEEIFQIVSNQIESQTTQIQAGVFIMQGSDNPIINFNNTVNAANINSTIYGDQIQHNYAHEQNLIDAFDEIQQIFNRFTENYQPSTEAEKQELITTAVEQVKQNLTLMKRVEIGGKAFIFEALQKASDQWWVSPFVKAIEAGIKGE
ncbi:NACHT domain-containing NTPase [Nostoc sp. TCL26-01]|uniref:NACHT domain-containing protein n=1 Tax=Nostoc sp. TCL26-01 TaxID=2576904 RepID=UPI0015B94CFD|nr:hypothetical protein [Nostoc sp. TCL26-01]QLE54789.1 hypothetical protein FD725_04240 [Nostoc sp. TCL26-01]